ncbi:MAG: multiubiquitin domain-containing protein [Bdellovibrionales bacterium]|nr:multiubiquitin domain-containing protein [Bdellovibrionales bacterium]
MNPEEQKPEKKTVTIYVEGTPHTWPKEEITYAEVVTLEFPDYPQHPEISYSVKYTRGRGNMSCTFLCPQKGYLT